MPREVGDWTQDKLKILSEYLPAYLTATTKATERIYIDGFAGPGRNELKKRHVVIDGSPLVALKARAKNGTRFDKLFFIENDHAVADELEAEVRALGDTRAHVIRGDINSELPKVLTRISKRSPTFVLLDTEGIEPKWETVAALAPWQTELLINFPLGMSINRNAESKKVTAYFGTNECVPLLRKVGTGRVRGLLDLYKGRLHVLGYAYTTEDDRLIKTSGNRRLYYLIFVSKVAVAKRIMDAVFRSPDAHGQGRLL